jgi:hypothetical protein
MKTAAKILLIPTLIAILTAFGMEATTLAGRNPSPFATIGDTTKLSFAFIPNDGKPFND